MGGPWRRNARTEFGHALLVARQTFAVRQRELAKLLGLATATLGKLERGDVKARGDVKVYCRCFVARARELDVMAPTVWPRVVTAKRSQQLVWILTGKLAGKRIGCDGE